MSFSIFAFVAGVLLLLQLHTLPSPLLLPLLLPCLLLYWRIPFLRLPLALVIGFLWGQLWAGCWLAQQLPTDLEGEDLLVEGRIEGLPTVGEQRIGFDFMVDRMRHDGDEVAAPGRIRLSWFGDAVPDLLPGDRWQLVVRLKRPHGFMNPGGFDYEGWAFRHGIHARGYVRKNPLNHRLDQGAAFSLSRMRWRIGTLLTQSIPSPRAAALLKALVIGDRSGLDPAVWEVLGDTGTNHLVAISGLHVGILAGLAFFLLNRLWRLSYRLTLLFPAQRAAAFAALTAATLYAGLAGFSIPTQRALIMLCVFMGALLLQRPVAPGHGFMLALLLVVLADPPSLLAPGFWLSFLAVGIILLGLSAQDAARRPLRSWLRMQWLIALGLAPVLLAWRGEAPLIAPLVNLLAIPFFTFLIIPLALSGTFLLLLWPALGTYLLQAVGWLLELSWNGLNLAAGIGHEITVPPGLPWYVWPGAVLGVLLLLAPQVLPGRWLGFLMLLPLALLQPHQFVPAGGFSFYLLDVGQGLAAVIRTTRHTLLYDTGPRYSRRYDAGTAVLLPFLHQSGVARPDRIIVSNGDDDHQGGLASLQAVMPELDLLSGEPNRIHTPSEHRAGSGQSGVKQCRQGQRWQWDGVLFEVLHPRDPQRWRGNDASCVLRVEAGSYSLLISGDVERRAEQALLQQAGERLRADLLVIPHHGSMTSSTPALVQATRPAFALAAAGYRNRYRFPRPEIVARWQAAGARVISTADSGTIQFDVDPKRGVSGPKLYRVTHGRIWNQRPMSQ